jgi:tetraacyldisaccharide 4'-kinase
MQAWLLNMWYGKSALKWVFLPFSWIYIVISSIRRRYLLGFVQKKSTTPVIVVGNLSVGGVGKTPLVIALANKMTEQGIKVGIVSRGYGSQKNHLPYLVQEHDSPKDVGDEPLLIAQKTGCPVVIARHRVQAVAYLEEHYQSQVIISDDGLQHYAMGRAIEIAVIDGMRKLGNGFCLPAGPLRELPSRLKTVDFIVVNGGAFKNSYTMTLQPQDIKQLSSKKIVTLDALKGTIAAVAAIGNPARFFTTLKQLGLDFNHYVFPDHYALQASDLHCPEDCIIMTEKDAVKCQQFATDAMYFLPVEAHLEEAFWNALWSHPQLQGVRCYG